jgi:hypothetical protein
MSSMKRALFAIIALISASAMPSFAATPQQGSIEFVAQAMPTAGLEEPVRGFQFYLLSKSFEEITQEVDDSYPKPDMNVFIEKLDVSAELKAWMKKNQWVTLSGEDFIHKVHTADVMDVPEFYKAYLDRNADQTDAGFPKPKYKPSDKVKDPAKYDKLMAEYKDAVRHYADDHPESIDGIDLNLESLDPSPKWRVVEGKRAPEIHRRVIELAQSTYLVARTQTNLQGQGFLRGISPGNYWISTLDVTANIGDVRPRWDAPVTVRPGDTSYVTLSNVNAVQPPPAKPE